MDGWSGMAVRRFRDSTACALLLWWWLLQCRSHWRPSNVFVAAGAAATPEPRSFETMDVDLETANTTEIDNEELNTIPVIVNGHPAPGGRYPYFSRVRRFQNGRYYLSCGAVLIAPQHVLTAAHCLVNDTKTASKKQVTHDGGALHPLRNDLWGFRIGYYCRSGDNCGFAQERIRVTSWWLHPRYNRFRSWGRDIALGRLEYPVTNDTILQSIPLLDTGAMVPHRNSATQQEFVQMGTGRINNEGQTPFVLQHVAVRYVTTAACEAFWGLRHGAMSDVTVCTSGLLENRTVVGACLGDSGSPLVATTAGRDTVVAIHVAAWLYCETKGAPDIKVRIASESTLSWLQDVICSGVVDDRAAFCNRTLGESPFGIPTCVESNQATFWRSPRMDPPRIEACQWIQQVHNQTRLERRRHKYCRRRKHRAVEKCKVSCGLCPEVPFGPFPGFPKEEFVGFGSDDGSD